MCPPSIPIRWIRISYHPCGPILDTYHYTYTSWPPRNTFFWPAFVTRILTPRTRKSGYGLLLGCRSPLDAGPFVKTFLDDARTPKPGKSSPSDVVYFGPASQSIKRGRISREGALDLRESRERRDRIFAGKTENAKILDQKQQRFQWIFFIIFWPRKNYCGGGYNFKTEASDHPGAYTSMPHPFFGAKDLCYIEKKVAKYCNDSLSGRPACTT